MSGSAPESVVETTEGYYDSSQADNFYRHVWGGEDIHIGIYDGPEDSIFAASRRTVATMASLAQGLGPEARVLDLGAGYGGAARFLASMFGCHVTCLNLSEVQNRANRARCAERGLSDRVRVEHGSFEEIPFAAADFDLVWSQDAILHSGSREQVLAEVARVLVPGGQFLFTDPMQSDDCPPGVLQPVLERIHLDSLGSFAFYRKALAQRGFAELACLPFPDQLGTHYARVRAELASRYDEMVQRSTGDYVDRMLQGLTHWVDAAGKGHLTWGILHFRLG